MTTEQIFEGVNIGDIYQREYLQFGVPGMKFTALDKKQEFNSYLNEMEYFILVSVKHWRDDHKVGGEPIWKNVKDGLFFRRIFNGATKQDEHPETREKWVATGREKQEFFDNCFRQNSRRTAHAI